MKLTTNKIIFQKIFLMLLIALTFSVQAHEESSKEFIHGITIKLDDEHYNFAGPPDGLNGASDAPGHKWLRTDKKRFLGKHFNTGPFSAPNFWSNNAGDGALLYIVDAVIDRWSEVKALQYFTKGFVQYHRLLNVKTKQFHPEKVVWLKRVAVKEFRLDGDGALNFSDDMEAYDVMPGVDYKLSPNWDMPYDPSGTCCHE
ncbi:MAG: hypothetical protein GXP14_15910 [Gammaproteobacteria bacterium]|nr:hypothetical protein [Gammaproteobacteria bacterium]